MVPRDNTSQKYQPIGLPKLLHILISTRRFISPFKPRLSSAFLLGIKCQNQTRTCDRNPVRPTRQRGSRHRPTHGCFIREPWLATVVNGLSREASSRSLLHRLKSFRQGSSKRSLSLPSCVNNHRDHWPLEYILLSSDCSIVAVVNLAVPIGQHGTCSSFVGWSFHLSECCYTRARIRTLQFLAPDRDRSIRQYASEVVVNSTIDTARGYSSHLGQAIDS